MNVSVHQRFHTPDSAEELASILESYASQGRPVEVRGLGSKLELGRPVQAAAVVSTERLSGISLYEPRELVLSAGAGTPIAEIEKLLDDNRQQLAFEPVDLAPVYGGRPGEGSVGGVFATGLSGSRRILSGAARDHILGVQAVNARGEGFKAGGRVMKNVTGYDVSKLLTGSHGTLAVMTEVTMKVLPKPEQSHTIVFFDVPEDAAVEAMCLAVGSPYEVSGTVHLQASLAAKLSDSELARAGGAVTAIRVESFDSATRYRVARLKETLAAYDPKLDLYNDASRNFWSDIRALKPFQGSNRPLWRISTVPTRAPHLVAQLRRNLELEVLYDWSGGLVWLQTGAVSDAGAVEIRRVLSEQSGHATLIRAEPSIRAAVDVFEPLPPALAGLTRSLKNAFDPAGILNPGRLYAVA